MKYCIKYYKTNSPFNFLLKPWRFYYFKLAGIYITHKEPIIYLKEFGENVEKVQFFDHLTHEEIPIYNPDYFVLTRNDYIIVKYKDGSMKKFNLEFYSYGILELVEKSLDT